MFHVWLTPGRVSEPRLCFLICLLDFVIFDSDVLFVYRLNSSCPWLGLSPEFSDLLFAFCFYLNEKGLSECLAWHCPDKENRLVMIQLNCFNPRPNGWRLKSKQTKKYAKEKFWVNCLRCETSGREFRPGLLQGSPALFHSWPLICRTGVCVCAWL